MPQSTKLDAVLEIVGSKLVPGQLPAGTVFTLQDIMTKFNISRTVAREVMRALEHMGLVAASRRVGLTVQPEESWDPFNPMLIRWRLAHTETRSAQLASLLELRRAVEPAAARCAATVASDDARSELSRLARFLDSEGHAGRGAEQDFLHADIEFHSLVLRSSGNAFYAALAPAVVSVMQGRTELGLQPRIPDEAALVGHVELAEAIAAADPAGAEKAARAIVQEATEALS
ncbi:FadR/GntR family transcriptional regulator [Corynebacterium renale]|uniref:GntR family transcriptional regulator n=1 Tax=Corynebacterium renale TaxID=1724 RepID=A0A2A9DQ49_9CORY|nr:FCD domain-containing protein [Corynebacterium renale]PFG28102.1 GntR family transcriptional regulator [Corynebacterium renale]SQI20696.1 GntR family transcriptional regulator [Corynebacterium renale]